MDFSGIAWWAYLVGAVAGAGFGVLPNHAVAKRNAGRATAKMAICG